MQRRIETIRMYFDGGVSDEEEDKVSHRVGVEWTGFCKSLRVWTVQLT